MVKESNQFPENNGLMELFHQAKACGAVVDVNPECNPHRGDTVGPDEDANSMAKTSVGSESGGQSAKDLSYAFPFRRHMSDPERLQNAGSADDLAPPQRPCRHWSLPLQPQLRSWFDMTDGELQTVMDEVLVATRLGRGSKSNRCMSKPASPW
jgi:hypothetical protein